MLPVAVSELASWAFIQRSLANPSSPMSVLSFFYALDFESEKCVEELREGSHMNKILPLWFMGGSEYDQLCEPFRDVVRQIGQRGLNADAANMNDAWNANVDGKVAQVILCDQLARNLFRGSGESFQYEHVSLNLAKELAVIALSSSEDVNLVKGNEMFPAYAYVCVLAMMHSEAIADHELAMKLIDWGEVSCSAIPFAFQRKFEEEHLAVIQRFGRYPHRNKALERTNTKEEEAYLADTDNLPMWAGGRKKM